MVESSLIVHLFLLDGYFLHCTEIDLKKMRPRDGTLVVVNLRTFRLTFKIGDNMDFKKDLL